MIVSHDRATFDLERCRLQRKGDIAIANTGCLYVCICLHSVCIGHGSLLLQAAQQEPRLGSPPHTSFGSSRGRLGFGLGERCLGGRPKPDEFLRPVSNLRALI